jgi:hypothetical protein
MHKRIFRSSIFSIISFLSLSVFAQGTNTNIRQTGYRIHARLESETATIFGEQTFIWRNTFTHPILSLGFRGEYADAMNEPTRTQKKTPVFIDSVAIVGNENSIAAIVSDSLQNERGIFEPVTWLVFSKPVMPEHTLRLHFAFRSQNVIVPNPSSPPVRSGLAIDWYPQVVAFSKKNVHIDTEEQDINLLQEFANYDVFITGPNQNNMAASGVLESVEMQDTVKTFHFSGNNLTDFVWAGCTDCVEISEKWQTIDIRLLLDRSNENLSGRYLSAAKKALAYLRASFGEFPYAQLTIWGLKNGVMPGRFAGYPTFIFAPPRNTLLGENAHFLERAVFYGCAWQYLDGVVSPAPDDARWLLTGLAAYSGMRMMEIYLGKSANLLDFAGVRLHDSDFNRLIYLRKIYPPKYFRSNPLLQYLTFDDDPLQAKAALFWSSAAYQTGQQAFEKILQNYFQQWKFQQPALQDFIDLWENTTGVNMAYLFEQAGNENIVLDYAVESLASLPTPSGKQFETAITVAREGTFVMPVVLEVHFQDGTKESLRWDGVENRKSFTMRSESRALSAAIDPDRKILLDANFTNNSRTVTAQLGDEKMTSRWFFWLQNLMLFLTGFSG